MVVKDAALSGKRKLQILILPGIAVENGGEFRHLDMGDTMRVNRSRRVDAQFREIPMFRIGSDLSTNAGFHSPAFLWQLHTHCIHIVLRAL
jgi:hypothetical protein